MITDQQTNFLYLADSLPKKYKSFYKGFESALSKCNVAFEFLQGTKDVWAVDYMPVQIDKDRFVQFAYNPCYLEEAKWQKTISDVDAICGAIGVTPVKTNIKLDGGNVVRSAKKAIITDRVFDENPAYDRKELTRKLYELLEVEKMYFIPQQPGDYTGHADGMVRFLDDDTIVVNDFKKEDKTFYSSFEIAVHNTGLECVHIPYNVYENKSNNDAKGDYINYLQMEQAVFVPIFGLKEDDEVVKLFETLFAGQKVITVPSKDIAKDGGILNCITWNIVR